MADEIERQEVAISDPELTPIREAQFTDDTKSAIIRLFKPNTWGQGGRGNVFYPVDLVNTEDLAVFEGTVGYLDHPDPGKEKQERKLRDVAFAVKRVFVDGTGGKREPMAEIEFLQDKAYEIAKKARNYIGVSMIGDTITEGGKLTPKGTRGRVVRRFLPGQRLDMVSAPGAGGRITQIIEAYREAGDNEMDYENLTLDELKEHRADLVTTIREAIAAELKAGHDAELATFKAELAEKETALAEKDAEVTSIRESLAQTGSVEEKLAELNARLVKSEDANKAVLAELAQTKRENLIVTTIREANVPDEYVGDLTELMRETSEARWPALIKPYTELHASAGSGGTAVQGNVEQTTIREALLRRQTQTQKLPMKAFGLDLSKTETGKPMSLGSEKPTRGPLARVA